MVMKPPRVLLHPLHGAAPRRARSAGAGTTLRRTLLTLLRTTLLALREWVVVMVLVVLAAEEVRVLASVHHLGSDWLHGPYWWLLGPYRLPSIGAFDRWVCRSHSHSHSRGASEIGHLDHTGCHHLVFWLQKMT
jgi:hypothetical protein